MQSCASYRLQNRAQLGEERRLELRSTIRVQLLRHSVAGDPFCIDSAGTRRGALLSDGDCFCPAAKAVYHRQDKLRRRPEREGALAAYNVDVERAEWLVGWQMLKRHARNRVGVAITVAHFA